MHATVLRMISNNSLSAFSAATTTAPVKGLQKPRLVRDQSAQPGSSGQSTAGALPSQRPAITPPRGTLLNLSV